MDQHNIISPSTKNSSQHQHTTTAAAPAFHHPNGFPPSPTTTRAPSADIEMVSFNGTSYISLRDILPSPTSPASFAFPRPPSHESAWCDIPIKNPLVKHAAIAYLQPMSSAPAEAEGKGILGAIVDRCGYVCGSVADEDEGLCCLWWWGYIVSRVGVGRNGPPDNYLEVKDEDEEDGCEVVDQLRIQCPDR